ncbi:MAG: hypothetical protein V4482_05385 [Pseudomonadota bacterium]
MNIKFYIKTALIAFLLATNCFSIGSGTLVNQVTDLYKGRMDLFVTTPADADIAVKTHGITMILGDSSNVSRTKYASDSERKQIFQAIMAGVLIHDQGYGDFAIRMPGSIDSALKKHFEIIEYVQDFSIALTTGNSISPRYDESLMRCSYASFMEWFAEALGDHARGIKELNVYRTPYASDVQVMLMKSAKIDLLKKLQKKRIGLTETAVVKSPAASAVSSDLKPLTMPERNRRGLPIRDPGAAAASATAASALDYGAYFADGKTINEFEREEEEIARLIASGENAEIAHKKVVRPGPIHETFCFRAPEKVGKGLKKKASFATEVVFVEKKQKQKQKRDPKRQSFNGNLKALESACDGIKEELKAMQREGKERTPEFTEMANKLTRARLELRDMREVVRAAAAERIRIADQEAKDAADVAAGKAKKCSMCHKIEPRSAAACTSCFTKF